MGSDGRGIKVHKTKICVFFWGGGGGVSGYKTCG